MPSKPQDNWNARRSFIEKKTDDLLRNNANINSVADAYNFIAENIFGCDVSTIYRAVKPYNGVKQLSVFQSEVTQLQLFNY